MDAAELSFNEVASDRARRWRQEAAAERLARAARGQKEVGTMTTGTGSDETIREWARRHVELGRRLRLRATVFALAMLVLTPVWGVGEYLSSGGWPERLSGNGNTGDWSPWIIWVALAWGFYVALTAVAVHFDRPPDEREIARQVDRLAGRELV